jgi:hypothetical protein
VVAPLVAVIIALGVYPQLVTHRTEDATVGKVREAAEKRCVRDGGTVGRLYGPGGKIEQVAECGETHEEVSEIK